MNMLSNGGTVCNCIHPGSRVYGPHGPLVPNTNRGKRRMREKVHGKVLKAIYQHKWKMVIDFDGKVKDSKIKSIKVVISKADIPINELSSANTNPPSSVVSAQTLNNDAI